MWLIDLLKLYHPDKGMTQKRALEICRLIPSHMLSDGMVLSDGLAKQLREAYPKHDWRVTLDRTGERARAMLTVLKDDPREHYVDGSWCPTCGKDHRKKKNRNEDEY